MVLGVAGAGSALAQTPEQRDGARPGASAVGSGGQRQIEDLRRQIDPDAPADPFAADRAADDARESRRRSERGRALDGSLDIEIDRADDNSAEGISARDDTDSLDDADDRAPSRDRDGQDRTATEDQRDDRVPQTADPLLASDSDDDRAATGRDISETSPYDATGIRVGSFLLFPELSVETVFTDNVLQSSTSARSDHAYALSPSLVLRSDWSRHSLEATLAATRSYYDDFQEQDDETYAGALQGRFDVTRRTAIQLDTAYLFDKEEVSSDDTPAGAAERTPFIIRSAEAELRHRFNRLTASLRGRLSDEDYDDVALIGGGTANNDDRDLTEREVTGRLSYEFRPGVAGFIEGSRNERDFDTPIDDNGIRSGSQGYRALTGLTLEFTGKLTGEIAAGFARQTPEETRLEDVSGLIFTAGLEWRATPLTTLRFDATSEIEETTLANSAGALVRRAEISVEHAFRENIIAGIAFGYEMEDFSGSGQQDRDYTAGITGEYLLTPSAALTGSYEFNKSTSSIPGNDYVENEVRLGFRLRR